MRLPTKIKIVNSVRSEHPMIRFDTWEGRDTEKILEHIAHKINEVIDFLDAAPEINNVTPTRVEREGDQIVHVHDWFLAAHLGNRGLYHCHDCGEEIQKPITGV